MALAVALVATGFGHRIGMADEPALSAFVQSGGDLADLCADDNGDGLPDRGGCPACHLVGCALLTGSSPAVIPAELAFVAKVVAPRENRAVRAVLDPARGLRSPPAA